MQRMNGSDLALDRRSRDRRISRRSLYYPERRTGFDRREYAPVTGVLRERPALLLGILVAINLCSLADWALTMRVLTYGAAEGNPLLAAMISANPTMAFAFKLVATLGVSIALWSWRRYRAVLGTAIAALLVYAGLMVYHAWGLWQLGVL